MCEKLLSQVQIAGAGAGKTYSLAEKVLMWYDNKKDDKIIYVITFTNDAKCNIIQRVFELNNGQVPANICIETVHSFLLNELLYPFSKYYYGMMRLYVALTRSKSDLILVVDETSLKKKNSKQIDEEFKKLGIEYLNSGYMESLEDDRKVCY